MLIGSEKKISLVVGQLQWILASRDFSSHRLKFVWPMGRRQSEAEGVETTFDQFLRILGEVEGCHADVTDHPQQRDIFTRWRQKRRQEGRRIAMDGARIPEKEITGLAVDQETVTLLEDLVVERNLRIVARFLPDRK